MADEAGEIGAVAGIGLSAATGNWIGAAVGAVGLGLSLFGGAKQTDNSKQIAQQQSQFATAQSGIQQTITGDEQNIENQKQQQMMLTSRRTNLQQMRVAQQKSAQGIAAATNQNAQFGTGLQGGLQGITDQSLTNIQGTNQNTEIGNNIFGIQGQISAQKQNLFALQASNASVMASLGSNTATNQGLMSLGGTLTGSAASIGRLSQTNFGGSGGGAGKGSDGG